MDALKNVTKNDEYFKVKYLGLDKKNLIPIKSGIGFGYIDKQLVFEISTQESEEPLRVSFFAKINKLKKSPEFEIGKIKNNDLEVCFYNPSENGISGLQAPLSLLVVNADILGFMFYLDRVPNSESYRISYEFYHGKTPPVEGVEK